MADALDPGLVSGRLDDLTAKIADLLRDDDRQRIERYPGNATGRQPIHTAYVPADRFEATTVPDWGTQALAALDEFGPPNGVDAAAESLVREKLAREPIEDLRVDFEDGYGLREQDIEDVDALRCAVALTAQKALFSCGIRMKSLEPLTRSRGIRSVELFLTQLLAAGPLPEGFRITLPKVTSVEQIKAMALLCSELESWHAVTGLRFEIQIEMPQAILGADGGATVARMLQAAGDRCVGLHYGTYDYSAALGIAAAQQSMEHPAADYAKAVMQVAAAGTGVPVSDGSLNLLPVGAADDVHAAWRLHMRLVHRSLERGFYQGWDLHPAQLVSRYAATFLFYRDNWRPSADRLRSYLARNSGAVMDEPATARALAGYLLRGVSCGALTMDEVNERCNASETTLSTLT